MLVQGHSRALRAWLAWLECTRSHRVTTGLARNGAEAAFAGRQQSPDTHPRSKAWLQRLAHGCFLLSQSPVFVSGAVAWTLLSCSQGTHGSAVWSDPGSGPLSPHLPDSTQENSSLAHSTSLEAWGGGAECAPLHGNQVHSWHKPDAAHLSASLALLLATPHDLGGPEASSLEARKKVLGFGTFPWFPGQRALPPCVSGVCVSISIHSREGGREGGTEEEKRDRERRQKEEGMVALKSQAPEFTVVAHENVGEGLPHMDSSRPHNS